MMKCYSLYRGKRNNMVYSFTKKNISSLPYLPSI